MPRIFITGCGIFVPSGADLQRFWKTLLRGKSVVHQISSFDASAYPTQIAAEIERYDPLQYFSPKQTRRTERYTQYALIAARQAVPVVAAIADDHTRFAAAIEWRAAMACRIGLAHPDRVSDRITRAHIGLFPCRASTSAILRPNSSTPKIFFSSRMLVIAEIQRS